MIHEFTYFLISAFNSSSAVFIILVHHPVDFFICQRFFIIQKGKTYGQ